MVERRGGGDHGNDTSRNFLQVPTYEYDCELAYRIGSTVLVQAQLLRFRLKHKAMRVLAVGAHKNGNSLILEKRISQRQ